MGRVVSTRPALIDQARTPTVEDFAPRDRI
jgi:hypothetical protein